MTKIVYSKISGAGEKSFQNLGSLPHDIDSSQTKPDDKIDVVLIFGGGMYDLGSCYANDLYARGNHNLIGPLVKFSLTRDVISRYPTELKKKFASLLFENKRVPNDRSWETNYLQGPLPQ